MSELRNTIGNLLHFIAILKKDNEDGIFNNIYGHVLLTGKLALL